MPVMQVRLSINPSVSLITCSILAQFTSRQIIVLLDSLHEFNTINNKIIVFNIKINCITLFIFAL